MSLPHNNIDTGNDPIARVRELLKMVQDEGTRNSIIEQMSPEAQEKLRAILIEEESDAAHPLGDFSADIARKRQLIRETAVSISERRIEEVQENNVQATANPEFDYDQDPLEQLRNVHPAALARALQGERAESWAVVFDFVDDHIKDALRGYLNHDATIAIERAQQQQLELPETLRNTIRRAIRETVVPRALQEHHQLMTNPYGVRAG